MYIYIYTPVKYIYIYIWQFLICRLRERARQGIYKYAFMYLPRPFVRLPARSLARLLACVPACLLDTCLLARWLACTLACAVACPLAWQLSARSLAQFWGSSGARRRPGRCCWSWSGCRLRMGGRWSASVGVLLGAKAPRVEACVRHTEQDGWILLRDQRAHSGQGNK